VDFCVWQPNELCSLLVLPLAFEVNCNQAAVTERTYEGQHVYIVSVMVLLLVEVAEHAGV
jgi:hypothetical protein